MSANSRLYLAAAGPEYDPDRDLALGPWCFADAEERFPDWEELSFLQAFETKEALSDASKNCAALTVFLIGQWKERLNARHGTSYGTDFWWPLLIRWVLQTTCAVWRRWRLIERTVQTHHGKTVRVLVFPSEVRTNWRLAGTSEVINLGLPSPDFDWWIYSRCLRRLAPDHWILEPLEIDSIPSGKRKAVTEPPFNTNAVKRFGRKVLGRLPFSDILGIGPVWTLVFSIWVCLIPKRRVANNFQPSVEAPPAYFPKPFLDLLDSVLSDTLPQFLGPDFDRFNSEAARNRYVPGRLFVTSAATVNDRSNFQMAHAVMAGERVVRFQHGSDYGTMAFTNIEWMTDYVMAAFLTWGWTRHDGHKGHFIPVPAPSLSRIENTGPDTQATDGGEIILVGTVFTTRSIRIDQSPDPAFLPTIRREKKIFVKTLDDEAREHFLYRPYTRGEIDMEDEDYFLRNFPGLKIHKGSLEASMRGCRLIVLDHPGTTLNIALAGNVPTVCFWNPALWVYAPEAASYFEDLRAAGVIYPDGVSAARHVNEILPDVQTWWRSDDVQAARERWTGQFAHTSKDWWWHWFRILRRI